MPNAAFRHDGDAHRFHNFEDHRGVAHPCHAAIFANIGGDALKGHHRAGAGILGNFRLVRVDHIHNHPALEHLCQAAIQHKLIGWLMPIVVSIRLRFHWFLSFFVKRIMIEGDHKRTALFLLSPSKSRGARRAATGYSFTAAPPATRHPTRSGRRGRGRRSPL